MIPVLIALTVVFIILTISCFGFALTWSDPVLYVFSLFLALASVAFTSITIEANREQKIDSIEECLAKGGDPQADTKYVNGLWVSEFDWCDL